MANKYEQPAHVLSRLRYYDGEFLKDEDLIAEQQFHIDRKWRHDRLLHAPGIAEGLDVSLAMDAAGTVRLRVSAGTAVDSGGRTILLGEERVIDIDPTWAGELWVAIRFNEKEDRLVQDDSATQGVKGATRFTQSPLIDVVSDLDALRSQGLAPVALDLVRFAAGEQPMMRHLRTFAGLRLPGPGAGFTLQVRAEPGPPGRPLALAFLDTPLEVVGDVQISGRRLKNANGNSIIQTNANDWLRINPDSQYPGTAIYNAVAISHGGLAVGEWTYQPQGRLVVTENALIMGNVGIGTRTPEEKLVVFGDVKIAGARLKNTKGFSIIQTNANDWLRINPDLQYPATALFNPVAINHGGLAVGEWTQQPQGRLVVTENALIGGNVGIGILNPEAKLEVAGDVKINGARLKNSSGRSIVQTNADDWLRINPDSQFLQTAINNSVAISGGGLAVGELSTQPQGQLFVKGNTILMGNVGIGTHTISAMLEVAGDVKISGNRLKDINNYSIVDTNCSRRLRINPDGDYEQVEFSSGDVKFRGARLRDANDNAIVETNNAEQRLRINPDGQYTKTDFTGDVDVGGTLFYRGVPIENRYAPAEHSHRKITTRTGNYYLTVADDTNIAVCEPNGVVVWGSYDIRKDIQDLKNASYAPAEHRHARITAENGHYYLTVMSDGNIYVCEPSGLVVWGSYGIRKDIQDLKNAVSDATLKRDVEPIHGAMEKLRQVRGVSFFWRDAERGTRRELGVLAQEVQPVLPELVSTLDGQLLGVRYDKFVPVLIQALKEQDERITRLEARLRDLGAAT